MSEYIPDRWCLVKIPFPEGDEVKVLGGWSGGYLDGDSWRLSSGVVKVEDGGEQWVIHNNSGSIYRCYKQSEGTNSLSGRILQKLLEEHGATKVDIQDILEDNPTTPH